MTLQQEDLGAAYCINTMHAPTAQDDLSTSSSVKDHLVRDNEDLFSKGFEEMKILPTSQGLGTGGHHSTSLYPLTFVTPHDRVVCFLDDHIVIYFRVCWIKSNM